MKRMKNKGNLIMGAIAALIGAACFLALPFQKGEPRFLIAGILALAWAAVSLVLAFTRRSFAERIRGTVDEPGRAIAMKSSHLTVQILNFALCAGCLAALALYGATGSAGCLTAAAVLCGVLLVMALTLLFTNLHYGGKGEPR